MTGSELEQERQRILRKMGRIRTMRRGTVSEQFLMVAHKGQDEPVRRGPYYLWQYWEHGKPLRRRLRRGPEVTAARKEVAAFREFERLCEHYVHVAEALAEAQCDASASEEVVKKGLKSRSSRAKKSHG